MKVTNPRLILLMLTFLVGVLLVYLHNGGVIPILDGEPDRNFCSH